MESRRVRFGVFEFDLARLELRREGMVLRLQSQPAQVLACLIQQADRTVSREELRQAIWGDGTYVDFERGLNFCVSQIRAVLKDDAAQPRYIRTLPKQGYQFIAPVQAIPEPASPVELAAGESAPVRRRMVAWAWAVGLGAAVLAAGSWFLYRPRAYPGGEAPPRVAVVRFDNETGNSDLSRFSDDLTDDVVERLTSLSQDRYRVIGNAQILRQPRDERDLNAIAASLHARYIVLGQVQADGAQTRVLAHLIRMPDQTHLWVVRVERPLGDRLRVESDLAQQIGEQFSPRLAAEAGGRTLPGLANH